jgi:glutamate carboxypeptidase
MQHPVRPRAATLVPLFLLLGFLCTAGAADAKSITTPRDKRPAESKKPASTLDGTERKLVEEVGKGVPAALDLLERSVNLNSGSLNAEGVRQVGAMFEPEFQALGFTTRWVDGAAWQRGGHLIATRIPANAVSAEHRRPGVRDVGGKSNAEAVKALPRVLLIGHLDTVFEKDSPFQRFQRLNDSTASGPGISDMKGGDVVMLLALKALKATGALDRVALTVVLTGDEERTGAPLALARKDLLEAADWADVALGFENGSDDPASAVIARRGAGMWRLLVSAKPFHSSQIFREDVGAGAIFETARVLRAFRDSLGSENSLTYSPGMIVGGTTVTYDPSASRGTAYGKSNVVADSAIVTGDLRPLTAEQRDRAQATMRRIVAASEPHARGEIVFDDSYPPFAATDGNRRLLSLYDKASRDLGLGAVRAEEPTRVGGADVAFAGDRVDMAIDGLGLKGEGAHTVEEIANLRTLPTQSQRAAVLLYRLARDWGKAEKH